MDAGVSAAINTLNQISFACGDAAAFDIDNRVRLQVTLGA